MVDVRPYQSEMGSRALFWVEEWQPWKDLTCCCMENTVGSQGGNGSMRGLVEKSRREESMGRGVAFEVVRVGLSPHWSCKMQAQNILKEDKERLAGEDYFSMSSQCNWLLSRAPWPLAGWTTVHLYTCKPHWNVWNDSIVNSQNCLTVSEAVLNRVNWKYMNGVYFPEQ